MVFQAVILLCIFSFYAAYFAKQITLRKQGISTNRLAKGDKPKRTMAIERALLIATYGIAAAQFGSVFFSRYLLSFYLPVLVKGIGLLLAAAGVTFFLLAITAMRSNWRAGVDNTQKTSIVTAGVYSISRNPAFVGFDLLYLGVALALPNILLCVTSLIGILLMHLQILEEEKFLPKAFGAEYIEYKKRVPRYLLFF